MSGIAKKNNNPTVKAEEWENTESLERIRVEPTNQVDPNKIVNSSNLNFESMSVQELQYQLELNGELDRKQRKQIIKLLKSKK